MPFSTFQEHALYHPQAGFYSNRGNAGRSGDFITSPEVGDLFAQVFAEALETWWRKLGRPDPFFVIEAGAGTGTLAAGILDAEPHYKSCLRYVTVERSSALRTEQTGRLPLQPADLVLGEGNQTSAGHVVTPLKHPAAVSLPDLPKGPITGVLIANELLDNLPVDLFERRNRRWYEVRVGLSKEGGFAEAFVPIDSDETEAELRRLVPEASDGTRIPLQHAAAAWLQRALDTIDNGKVVLIDYARTTRWMARNEWHDWLRTYRGHRPGSAPLDAPGTQDITCEVAVDQLTRVRKPDRDNSQTEFLEYHGLIDLMAEAREAWHTRAALGDLGAARARSRVNEGRALTDPKGLGRYRVLEWDLPARSGPESSERSDEGSERE